MMIDIQKIETFLRAAENLSLSEAAKQLHLGQPAVSHHIKVLEQELDVSLFIRSNIGSTDRSRQAPDTLGAALTVRYQRSQGDDVIAQRGNCR